MGRTPEMDLVALLETTRTLVAAARERRHSETLATLYEDAEQRIAIRYLKRNPPVREPGDVIPLVTRCIEKAEILRVGKRYLGIVSIPRSRLKSGYLV